MSAENTFLKDSAAVLDYQWDWSDWLASGETIVSGTVTTPTGIVEDSEVIGSTAVTAWLSGGTVGVTYVLQCTITTSAGRTDNRKMIIRVVDR